MTNYLNEQIDIDFQWFIDHNVEFWGDKFKNVVSHCKISEIQTI